MLGYYGTLLSIELGTNDYRLRFDIAQSCFDLISFGNGIKGRDSGNRGNREKANCRLRAVWQENSYAIFPANTHRTQGTGVRLDLGLQSAIRQRGASRRQQGRRSGSPDS
jgi:hypothetical protein